MVPKKQKIEEGQVWRRKKDGVRVVVVSAANTAFPPARFLDIEWRREDSKSSGNCFEDHWYRAYELAPADPERVLWTNPRTGNVHCVDQRVMWVFGRKNFADYGEVGTVVSVPVEGDPDSKFQVQMDQPRNKQDTNTGRLMTFSTDNVISLAEVCHRTAERLRAAAKNYDDIKKKYDEFGVAKETSAP